MVYCRDFYLDGGLRSNVQRMWGFFHGWFWWAFEGRSGYGALIGTAGTESFEFLKAATHFPVLVFQLCFLSNFHCKGEGTRFVGDGILLGVHRLVC